ncbi:hypothetical protein [Ammoniphilus sp. YIM 78166]|uniref:hypothetical protein n=1 Tax=Ammoniphilus sp. YIM 78166 TaxID=1644106 RepID=UPI00106F4E29|nr:hypothetical protein [Ammoniphilus sp. YIM 78166]
MNHLYIRHTVGGKLFLDTKLHQASYEIVEKDGCWEFHIHVPDDHLAHDILKHRDELNIFEVAQGQANQKSWYYTRDGSVEYDHATKRLTIYANSKIDYPV